MSWVGSFGDNEYSHNFPWQTHRESLVSCARSEGLRFRQGAMICKGSSRQAQIPNFTVAKQSDCNSYWVEGRHAEVTQWVVILQNLFRRWGKYIWYLLYNIFIDCIAYLQKSCIDFRKILFSRWKLDLFFGHCWCSFESLGQDGQSLAGSKQANVTIHRKGWLRRKSLENMVKWQVKMDYIYDKSRLAFRWHSPHAQSL